MGTHSKDIPRLRGTAPTLRSQARRLMAIVLLLGGVAGVLGACTAAKRDSSAQGTPEPADHTTFALDVCEVRFPEGMRYGDMGQGPCPSCPLEDHFDDFSSIDWSRDFELSEFGKPAQEGFGYYTVHFENGRIFRIEENYEHADYPPLQILSGAYEIDEIGRLVLVKHLFRPEPLGREGGGPIVRTVRIEYEGNTRAPRRLTVSGDPSYWRVWDGGGDPYFIHYECEFLGGGFWRVVAREAKNASGEPVERLRGGRAAREELHYHGPEAGYCAQYSELFDEDGKPVMRNGKPVHVKWHEQTADGYRYLGSRGEYVDPDGEPLEEEE